MFVTFSLLSSTLLFVVWHKIPTVSGSFPNHFRSFLHTRRISPRIVFVLSGFVFVGLVYPVNLSSIYVYIHIHTYYIYIHIIHMCVYIYMYIMYICNVYIYIYTHMYMYFWDSRHFHRGFVATRVSRHKAARRGLKGWGHGRLARKSMFKSHWYNPTKTMENHNFSGKSPFLVEKSQFLVEKTQFLVEKSLFLMENHWLTMENHHL